MSVTNEIAGMKTDTAMAQAAQRKASGSKNDMTDKNMFLNLMLKQMEYQDPTEPTSNEQWLSQMAQYSSLESSQNTQKAIDKLSSIVTGLTENLTSSININQTLGLLGKEVTLFDPADESGMKTITGKVEEASFESGAGTIKVGGQDYPISHIKTVKN